MFDSGSSVGEISGHSKPINAVAMRRERPFRAVTASDDNNLIFYHGVPYKYAKTISTHTRFVQDVAYARSGDYFASVGSDSKLFLYDGKTGDTIADLSAAAGADAHKGTIFAVDFSPDSKMILTSGADGTAKVWDVAAQKVVATYDFNGQSSDKVEDQQVGNVWLSAQQMLSLSFSGELNVLDLSKPGKEASKLYGPSKSIGAFAKAADAKTLLAGV